MAGGLINLGAYGTQDIFLTGYPQITFFKTVYRRYTNFAIESLPLQFQGKADFGETLTATIPRNGDLLSKMYLQITLPQIDLEKPAFSVSVDETNVNVKNITMLNSALRNYMNIILTIIRFSKTASMTSNRTLNDIVGAININFFFKQIKDIIDKNIEITLIEQNEITQLKVANFSTMSLYSYYRQKLLLVGEYMKTRINSLLTFLNNVNPAVDFPTFFKLINATDIQTIVAFTTLKYNNDTTTSEQTKKEYLLKRLSEIVINLNIFNTSILSDKYDKETLLSSLLDGTYKERYKFAWVKQIGHTIIKNISIEIGGSRIDKHTGEWLSILNSLTLTPDKRINYDKMIGNVDDMTVFDDKIKKSYVLYIPLQFWFCKHYGLAIPIINLNFHDVKIVVDFKKIEECCYVEAADISFFNMVKMYDISIKDVALYTDYIYLDTDERKRFAQSSHEYLIDQLQINNFNDVNIKDYVVDMMFNHPVKELIWTAQKNIDIINVIGTKECLWADFSYGGKNPIDSSHIDFNTYTRMGKLNSNYYNYVQPYQTHKSFGAAGINMYSFAIAPEEQQPSGSANFSKIDSAKLYISFKQPFFDSLKNDVIQFDTQTGFNVNVYAVNYNVLRFMGGMAGVAFALLT